MSLPELVRNKGDRIIYQGDTTRFRIPVNQKSAGVITPFDVSGGGFASRMQFRETPESSTALLTLTSETSGGLTMDNGFIGVLLTATQAAALTAAQMVSDCQIVETASSEKVTVDVSTYRLQKEITKDV